MVYAQQIMEIPSGGGFSTEPQQPQQPGEYIAGTIASIQNDKDDVEEQNAPGYVKRFGTNIQAEQPKPVERRKGKLT